MVPSVAPALGGPNDPKGCERLHGTVSSRVMAALLPSCRNTVSCSLVTAREAWGSETCVYSCGCGCWLESRVLP